MLVLGIDLLNSVHNYSTKVHSKDKHRNVVMMSSDGMRAELEHWVNERKIAIISTFVVFKTCCVVSFHRDRGFSSKKNPPRGRRPKNDEAVGIGITV